MPTFFLFGAMFITGLILGAIIIVCLMLRGITFKKKYGFTEPSPLNLREMNPLKGSASHLQQKESVDGAAALSDFNHKA